MTILRPSIGTYAATLATAVLSLALSSWPISTYAWEVEVAATESSIDQRLISDLLAEKRSVIEDVFGTIPTEYRAVSLPGGDVAVGVHGGSHHQILLFRVDREGNVVWHEDSVSVRTPGYKTLPRLYPGQDGDLFVLWQQTAPNGFMVRRMARDGTERWTVRVTPDDVRAYDVISTETGALIIASSNTSSVKVFRLEADGTLGWQRGRITLADRSSAHNPVSLTVANHGRDGVAVWYRTSESPARTDFVAHRFRLEDGMLQWAQPLVIGPAPDFTLVMPRKITVRALDGIVEAFLYKGEAGDVRYDVEEYRVHLGLDGSTVVLEEDQRNAG